MSKENIQSLPDLAKSGQISEFVFDRAEKLERVLVGVDVNQGTLDRLKQPFDIGRRWGREASLVHVDQQFVSGMKKVAYSLYEDLKAEKSEVLAKDLVEQEESERPFVTGELNSAPLLDSTDHEPTF